MGVLVAEEVGRQPTLARWTRRFGHYGKMMVQHVDVLTFILRMVKRNFIDYIIMDIEGPEYDIIPLIAVENLFVDNNIAICQMNVEFHKPPPKERKARYSKIMYDLVRAGRYGILRHEKPGYQRMFLVNYREPKCVKKYLDQFFTNS
ncbi:hypothetical protein KIN20_009755 [Parelaphostrongylus tenuis]|uniref:Methyltransferase FkbM domain-containing protein n=1 Tax=Parelaphostrongylus tenuis TaxID=148309 RepID=A0AAD5M8L8_PARTN|nr:hypothetical protein KIN20_009755 [Parelaphostrongylus tenuis]